MVIQVRVVDVCSVVDEFYGNRGTIDSADVMDLPGGKRRPCGVKKDSTMLNTLPGHMRRSSGSYRVFGVVA